MPDPIFITARFRSGSTMLWNIYNHLEGYCAYYEPLHDNLIAHIRHTQPMASHRGVASYWASYEPILDELARLHRHGFGVTRLLLEEDDEWPELEAYLHFLIDSAGDARPVLQFNRIDLRLPWIRRRFPHATIVHLHREARESFASMVSHLPPDQIDAPDTPNLYDLLEWTVDLLFNLPFLATRAAGTLYERAYFLWKLSGLMGSRASDLSLSYEDDFADGGKKGLAALVELGILEPDEVGRVTTLIEPARIGTWRPLHDATWFAAIESTCDAVLAEHGLEAMFGLAPVREIRAKHEEAWADNLPAEAVPVSRDLLVAYSRQRSEVTRLLHLVRSLEAHVSAETPGPPSGDGTISA